MSLVNFNYEVLKNDAENIWEDASEKLLAIKAAIPEIETSDFSLPFGAVELSQLFTTWREGLGEYLSGGSNEFLRFEKILLLAAIDYAETHSFSVEEINTLKGEIDI